MKNDWLRLWHDMPNDPKWRTIARASSQTIPNVIAVYTHMLVTASNATERGRTQGWSDEDVASALDIKTDEVTAIREAMQDRVIDQDRLLGWERRQPKREDGSSERSKAWRENQTNRLNKEDINRTQPNATERNRTLDKRREDKKKKEKEPKGSKKTKWIFCEVMPLEFSEAARAILNGSISHDSIFSEFQDHWKGNGETKADWLATWRNWCRRSIKYKQFGEKYGANPTKRSITDEINEAIAATTGRN